MLKIVSTVGAISGNEAGDSIFMPLRYPYARSNQHPKHYSAGLQGNPAEVPR